MTRTYHSMLKFLALDVLFVGGVAVSSGPALDSAFAPSFLGRPFGQLPMAVDSHGMGNQELSDTQQMMSIRLPLNPGECEFFWS
jgi:hypothetical protein